VKKCHAVAESVTTLAQLRKAALSYPETAEQVTGSGTVAFTVDEEWFASLGKAIGGPATRALVGAGITTLAQVAAVTDAELLAMHGVGPRAVRILREALA
jgi:predicted flap endonuclease-1-like 5' DNA nuclease